MAAPELTVWGPIVKGSGNPNGRQGKIGIYTNVTNTATQTTVKVQVWFWTIYSCDDYYCTLYYNAGTNVTSATTAVKTECDINHTIATGTGWNTANQTKLYEKTYTYTRGNSDVTYKVYAKFSGIYMLDSAMTVNTSYTVQKLETYTVSYNANGGSGAPSSQTQKTSVDVTLSTTVPKRDGYTFQGWATSKSGSKVYDAGDKYTARSSVTLYAVWKIKTYTVTYNANGGGSAPGKQTKTHGVSIKLSTTILSRANYIFLGWSKSSSATIATYAAGANFTDNANTTLYAVWKLAYVKPVISGFKVDRCASDGAYTDDGECIRVRFAWSCFHEVSEVVILVTHNGANVHRITAQTMTNPLDLVLPNVFDPEKTYTVSATVADSGGSTTVTQTLPGGNYTVDFLAGGKGVAIGKAAELAEVLDINMIPMFRRPVVRFDKDFQITVQSDPWRPYLKAGDSFDVDVKTAGYITNSGADVSFFVPLSVPVIGKPTVTASSVNGIVLRQGGTYACGSGPSSFATPSSYSASLQQWCAGVWVTAKMADLTNVTNNDAIGVYWEGRITFS